MKTTYWALVLIAATLLFSSSNINWGGEHYRTVLQSDSWAYHAYLPSLLLQHDPNFGAADSSEPALYFDAARFQDYRVLIDDTAHINKYYIGTALMQLPLFLVAHGYALATGGAANGWSKPYVVAVNLSAIAFLLIGLWCLARLLATYEISDGVRGFTLAVFVFGTNLFYYSVAAPGMSHAYSFGLCSALLFLVRRMALSPEPSRAVWLGALLGAMILIRPVNALIVLALPILFDDMAQFRRCINALARAPWAVIRAVMALGAVAMIQLLYYRIATGHWFVYSYGTETFHWTQPHMLEMLVSYRKGLFVYTPITALSCVGLYYLWRRSPSAAVAWVFFTLLLTYVLSCWWIWWYGGSFGSRVYIEYLPLFALPFALAVQQASRRWRHGIVAAALVLVALCQIQTYQARYNRIHWADMDRTRYWDEFLRIDRIPR